MKSSIEHIIVKYLTNEASVKELSFLSDWVLDPNNELFFKHYVKIHFEISTLMNKPDADSIKKALLEKIEEDTQPKVPFNYKYIFKYAAILALLFTGSYFYLLNDKTSKTVDKDVVTNDVLTKEPEAITIRLDDGSTRIINPESKEVITDKDGNLIGTHQKNQLNYVNSSVEHLVYNTLKVPYGKKFDVILSDGTHVYLNSGTSIKYPVKFLKNNNTRDVFLSGEAYFDVTKNKEQPFIVHANSMNVKVLGTGFNISNYIDASTVQTVLVNGSVELFNDSANESLPPKTTVLKPGTKAEWDKNNEKINLEDVDTSIYTAWKEGKLIFRNSTFLSIRKTLERHYNVTIKNSNKDLESQLFDATFDIESIREVMETFSRSYTIDYKIINNEIIID